MSARKVDVVVVGAGPSGLTTATALARAGVSVLVIEKHPGLSVFPKATGLRPRTMEILRSWGLEPRILHGSQQTRLTMAITPMLSITGTEVSMGLPTDQELEQASPCRIAVCPQDRLEAILLDHLLESGGQVLFETELIDLDLGSDGVSLSVTSATEPDLHTITGRYVVGADGARSRVREALGIGLEHLGSEGSHLATLFRADLSSVVPEVPHALTMTVAPGLEGMFVPTGERDRWIYDIEWHPESGQTLSDWPAERITNRIRAAAGLPNVSVELVGTFPWDFGAAVSTQQRVGRGFLVGDAAHRTTPRGATGMNTGIADGHNLGWKLAWVCRGWAEESLLDSYEAERAAVGRANADASLQSSLGASSRSALAHDFEVVYSSDAVRAGGPLAGWRAPHAWIGDPQRGLSTLDLFDGRLTLLTGPDGMAWREWAAELARAGAPVAVLSIDTEVDDRTGAVERAYGLGSQGCALVRPDGYVAWHAPMGEVLDGSELTEVVSAVLGRRIAYAPA